MQNSKPTIILIMIFLIIFMFPLFPNNSSDLKKIKTALLIIDVQKFYFPQGSLPLVNPESACKNIQKILKKFRTDKQLIIHVRHNAKKGAQIHSDLTPVNDEKVISKNYANSFRETELLNYLNINKIKQLVICGMQTHMCVEAATRAASDLGFKCILVHDACATRDLKFKGNIIGAKDVHDSTLSALSGSYAKILSVNELLEKY